MQEDKEDKIKSCIFCEHCSYNESVWYSTLTGGEAGYFFCSSNNKQNLINDSDLEGLAGWTLKANTCIHYQLANKIKKELQIK